MRIHVAYGLYTFFLLMVVTAWSWEAANFRWVKSDTGELMCGMSPPNKTLKVIGTRALCISECSHVCPSPCQAVNYWQNTKLCQHFYYVPCSYGVQQGCVNYKVQFFWQFHTEQHLSQRGFIQDARVNL